MARRGSTDIVYGCHAWIAMSLVVGAVADAIWGSPATSEELAVAQGVGMLVLLPLALASLLAAVMGAVATLKLMTGSPKEWGIVVLLLLLVTMVVAFMIEDETPGPNRVAAAIGTAYTLAVLVLATRWFTRARARS